MSGLKLHANLPPQPPVPYGHPAIVVTSVMPTLWEEPSQDQHHSVEQACSCLSSQAQMQKYTRCHRVAWGVDPGTHGQEQAAPSWWQEFRSLCKGFSGRIANDMVHQAARKQTTAFMLPTVQEEMAGLVENPTMHSQSGLTRLPATL